jgi:hypothetical protein
MNRGGEPATIVPCQDSVSSSGARVLGEFGHDPNRYTTAKSRKNYAGTSPLT